MKNLEQEYYLTFEDTIRERVVILVVDKNSLSGSYMFAFSENANSNSDLWRHCNYATKSAIKQKIKNIKNDKSLIIISEEFPTNNKVMEILDVVS